MVILLITNALSRGLDRATMSSSLANLKARNGGEEIPVQRRIVGWYGEFIIGAAHPILLRLRAYVRTFRFREMTEVDLCEAYERASSIDRALRQAAASILDDDAAAELWAEVEVRHLHMIDILDELHARKRALQARLARADSHRRPS